VKHSTYEISRSLRVNQVKVQFTNKPITAWGGLATIVAKLLEVLEFRSWVESTIPIKEKSNNAKGVYEKVLATFLTVLSGGERFSHLSWWSHGSEAIKKVFSITWLPKASSALTRFWAKVSTQQVSEKLGEVARRFATTLIDWQGIREDTPLTLTPRCSPATEISRGQRGATIQRNEEGSLTILCWPF